MRPGTRLRDAVMPTSRVAVMATMITMNRDELVKAISCPPTWPIVNSLLIWNWWIGSAAITGRLVCLFAPARRLILAAFDRRIRNASGYHSRLAHHVPHARRKAEQCEHEHPPRQGPEPLVDQPAETSPDQHTRDKLGGEPETAREARVIGRRPGCGPGG